jgi:hypothetical protein
MLTSELIFKHKSLPLGMTVLFVGCLLFLSPYKKSRKITNSSTLYKNEFTTNNSKAALHPADFWDMGDLGWGILGF